MKYFSIIILIFAVCNLAVAQSTGTLRGQVVDPSGAVVPNATVAILQSGGPTYSGKTNNAGNYEIGNLPAGSYTVTANAEGFTAFIQNGVQVTAGQVARFNIALEILVEQQKVNVEEQSQQVQVNPQNNASALVLSGKDLEALPDDPDELQSDLEALAGPSAGPDGGQLYIDGFTAGQLPPKSSIREIRINQNPFSAEYDKLGYGRIEIFTKPGTDKFHGQFSVVGNDSPFNSRNPFLGDAAQSPYDSVIYMGNIGGPINKKASFFFDVQRRNIDEIAVVNAPAIDFTQSVPNPRTRTNLSPRIDYQLTPNNSISARYQYYRDTWRNAGVGGLVLPEAGYNTFSTEHTLQVTDTQVIGAKAVNETRFQYLHDTDNQNPISNAVGIDVLGAFVGGGAASGTQTSHEDHYEIQNYTSISAGKHFVKFGARVRAVHDVSTSGSGFNGTYTFATLDDYTSPTPTPSQLSINASGVANNSVPSVTVNLVDAGLYIQDDWKVRPTLTLSAGLRFETQNDIHDHADWGPRIGFAWGIGERGKAPKTVLRGGFGLFYDRFSDNLVATTYRFNGVTEQQFVVNNPQYIVPPPIPISSSTLEATYQISPNLRSPYIIQTALSLERQITKSANATLTYLNSRGVHGLMSTIPNSPEPDPPVYPFGGTYDPIVQYSSVGFFRQNQLIASVNFAAGSRLSFHGFYSLNYANSDPIGSSGFGGSFTTNYPSDSHDVHLDYGRAAFAIRNRVFFGGTISLPFALRLSPFLVFNSGSPYNVTFGEDLANDLQFNVRPAFAANPTGVCVSPLASCHYTQPTTPADQIPINYLTGPDQFTVNFRLAKTFGFGPELKSGAAGQGAGSPSGHNPVPHAGGGGGGGMVGFGGGGPGGGHGGGMFGAAPTGRRYNLTFSINARNAFNRVNPGTPIGVVSSPNFGQSISLAGGPFSSAAANRKLELQAMFSF
ncbi:MAG TPA: carboxypeptidase regulatory-like domain-containing protein [Terriglobales bacterium]|nr:carboxypeptidase regulatory-like domain-containing protein [Terriglobales bacterium]